MCGQPVIQPKAGAVKSARERIIKLLVDAVKSARERIIKLLVDVRVDATHQSTALDIFQ